MSAFAHHQSNMAIVDSKHMFVLGIGAKNTRPSFHVFDYEHCLIMSFFSVMKCTHLDLNIIGSRYMFISLVIVLNQKRII